MINCALLNSQSTYPRVFFTSVDGYVQVHLFKSSNHLNNIVPNVPHRPHHSGNVGEQIHSRVLAGNTSFLHKANLQEVWNL